MLVTYFRSSSYNNYDYCPMQYFITYVLGHIPDTGQRAEIGTIVHKTLECLSLWKKDGIQNGSEFITDDVAGRLSFSDDDFFKITELSEAEVDGINNTRVNKEKYKMPCQIKHGHNRMGVAVVESVFDAVYSFYTSRSKNGWKPIDRRDCLNYIWMALDYKDGMFDPRKRHIVEAEAKFDIVIDRPWAKYEFSDPCTGQIISGNLAIKGTVDLITRTKDDIMEVIDWKTGQRLDWTSRKNPIPVKTYEKLCSDPQLLLYNFALHHIYPKEDAMIFTIFYVKDGGPFSICFDAKDLDQAEKIIRDRFEEVKADNNPQLLDPTRKHFKCKNLCHYCKNSFDGSTKSICQEVKESMDLVGMNETVKKYTKKGHAIGYYQEPGA